MRLRLTSSDPWLLRTRSASLMAIITALLAALYVVVWVQPVLALIVPVAGAALPLAARTRAGAQQAFRWAITIVVLFIAAGAMTVGALFLPTLISLMVGLLAAGDRAAPAHATTSSNDPLQPTSATVKEV